MSVKYEKLNALTSWWQFQIISDNSNKYRMNILEEVTYRWMYIFLLFLFIRKQSRFTVCLYIIRKLGTWALVHFQILRFVYFHSFYLILSPKKRYLDGSWSSGLARSDCVDTSVCESKFQPSGVHLYFNFQMPFEMRTTLFLYTKITNSNVIFQRWNRYIQIIQ